MFLNHCLSGLTFYSNPKSLVCPKGLFSTGSSLFSFFFLIIYFRSPTGTHSPPTPSATMDSHSSVHSHVHSLCHNRPSCPYLLGDAYFPSPQLPDRISSSLFGPLFIMMTWGYICCPLWGLNFLSQWCSYIIHHCVPPPYFNARSPKATH